MNWVYYYVEINMDKNISVIIILMLALTTCALSSCVSNMALKGINNSKDKLDWEGVYSAVILSAEGHFLDVRVKLKLDQSFEFYYGRMDGAFDPFFWKGAFMWDQTGNIIMANINGVRHQYKVVKDKLIRLDMDNFVLEKAQP